MNGSSLDLPKMVLGVWMLPGIVHRPQGSFIRTAVKPNATEIALIFQVGNSTG